jgi:hypothetical protein
MGKIAIPLSAIVVLHMLHSRPGNHGAIIGYSLSSVIEAFPIRFRRAAVCHIRPRAVSLA